MPSMKNKPDFSGMTLGDFERSMLEQQFAIAQGLREIWSELRAIRTERAAAFPAPMPHYSEPLASFPSFDWEAIDATVEERDSDGVATVKFRGHRYVRRSAANKFEPAIWFSRTIGKDDNGDNLYERLVTFKSFPAADPLPEKTKGALGSR